MRALPDAVVGAPRDGREGERREAGRARRYAVGAPDASSPVEPAAGSTTVSPPPPWLRRRVRTALRAAAERYSRVLSYFASSSGNSLLRRSTAWATLSATRCRWSSA